MITDFEGHGPRRRATVLLTALAVAAGGVVALGAGPAAAASTCPAGTSLGVLAPLTGANRAIGSAISRGASLAVLNHNKVNPNCHVRLVQYDTLGDPARAVTGARAFAATRSVLGVVGPAFSGEATAAGATFERAGLPVLTPSATNPSLTTHRWATFFRGAADDDTVGVAAAKLINTTLNQKRTCVVHDNTVYGARAGAVTARALGTHRVCTVSLDFSRPNYAEASRRVRSARADAVYYAGYDVEAASLVRRLRADGFRGRFVGSDGVNSALFVQRAGAAADGALTVAGSAPGTLSAALTSSYRSTFGTAVPTYASEAFDAANVQLAGIDHGVLSRPSMQLYLRRYDAAGVTQRFRFTGTGELAAPSSYSYVVRRGALAYFRRIG